MNYFSEYKYNIPKLMGCNKGSSKREFYRINAYIFYKRKDLKQSNLHLRELEKQSP